MIYCNTPLSGSLQTSMHILQNRCTRSDLPLSNEARQQLGLQPEKLRTVYKNEHLPSHDLHMGKILCIKMLQASGGIQQQLQVYVCSLEVTI